MPLFSRARVGHDAYGLYLSPVLASLSLADESVSPHGFKSEKVIALKGQKTAGTKPSNNRENVTVVATISAAGVCVPPLRIFKNKRLNPAGAEVPGPEGPMYKVTDPSSIQGSVFLDYISAFSGYLIANDLKNNKPPVLILNGHASHVTPEVLEFTMNNIHLFQLPPNSSHVTQPLDVGAFVVFKSNFTTTLNAFHRNNDGKMPVNSDIVGLVSKCPSVRGLDVRLYGT